MKIAVTSIAKNESAFVERWFNSALDADLILLCDTGSTDDTLKQFESLSQNTNVEAVSHSINIRPWRFDNARNTNLALIPDDVDFVIHLDMDEVLVEGWREALEKSYAANPAATRFTYKFIWSWIGDKPGVLFNSDKIHRNGLYTWVHPAHEVLTYVGDDVENMVHCDMEIHHHPDNTKPRSQYLDLLEIGVKERPNDDRISHYYARELYYRKDYSNSFKEFERHLSLPSAKWDAERAMSMVYMSRMFDDGRQSMYWARRAVAECPHIRETWLNLATISYKMEYHREVVYACENAFEIDNRFSTYISDPQAWGSFLYDIGSVSAHAINRKDLALEWIEHAIENETNPTEIERMNFNKVLYNDNVNHPEKN
tara:strand:+ start:671 stop:1780 length:1110 start_codon:yes stop_codon:yes gene_type:complete